MKLLHLSDLHIGMRLREFSLLEDQSYILTEILGIVRREAPDGVILAGDLYDKAAPSAEAVALLDRFLTELCEQRVPVLAISGNHDSPERIAFGSRIMQGSRVYLSPVYDGTLTPVTLTSEDCTADVYLMPFVKPAQVRRFFPDRELGSYTEAMAAALEGLPENPAHRSILVCHQFVTGAERSASEQITVGGTDNVDASVFSGFDYVALGHIHRPQNVGGDTIRYCGTPLKYSFSEAEQEKSVTVVEFGAQGPVTTRTIPLHPLRDMRELRGSYDQLTDRRNYQDTPVEDYLHITLTDEEDVPDAMARLRVIYPNLMLLDYDNRRTRSQELRSASADIEEKSPLEQAKAFYADRNGGPMSPKQEEILRTLMEKIWDEEQEDRT